MSAEIEQDRRGMRAPELRACFQGGLVVDNFAGGGGASTGIEQALGRKVDIAINHDAEALALHHANHPDTEHYQEDIYEVDPNLVCEGRPVDVAWFSPDCKHFSKARGGAPVSPRVRGLAWVVLRWAKSVKPKLICVENVEEFKTWGPVIEAQDEDGNPKLDAKGRPILIPDPTLMGHYYKMWWTQLQALGYRVEKRVLQAHEYGVPTTRQRLFIVAVRHDVADQVFWPEPTHGEGLRAPVAAHEIIDWSLPCPSIFERKRPLVDSTMMRIAKGYKRYVMEAGDDAYIIRTGHYSNHAGLGSVTLRGQRLNKPLGTVCASVNDKALVVPWIARHWGGMVGKPITETWPTITSKGCQDQLAQAVISPVTSGQPLLDHSDEVRAWLLKYYGTAVGQTLNEPLHTITTKARQALVVAGGAQGHLVDIGMRMLSPRELYRAQGFPEGYIIERTPGGRKFSKGAQIRMCGNSVPPGLARVIVSANTHTRAKEIAA